MLAKMFCGDLAPAYFDSQGRFFIDRNGENFGAVLAYLRGEQLPVPNIVQRAALLAEASYYQVRFTLIASTRVAHMCRLSFLISQA